MNVEMRNVERAADMIEASNVSERVVLDFLACLSEKDRERAPIYLDTEISWTIMVANIPGGGRYQGLASVLQVLMGGASGVFRKGDPKVHVDSIASTGDFVMAEAHGSGARADDGLSYENRYAFAFELRGAKILNVREYMDTLYIARFLRLDIT